MLVGDAWRVHSAVMTAPIRDAVELGRDLLALRGMDGQTLRGLLRATGQMLGHAAYPSGLLSTLVGRSVATVFLESSTRTRGSFTLAGQRLGAVVADFSSSNSTSKGESLTDTVRTVASMGVDAIVLRSSRSGAAECAARAVGVPILNAGDGRHEHPTQGLLDAYTLCEALGRTQGFDLSGVRVAIVGDVAHSRVARSATAAMTTLGATVELVGPESLAPERMIALGATVSRDLDAAIERADVVMMLRVQTERGATAEPGYRAAYGLTAERARRLRSGTVVMHPGPMNQGVEIDAGVADGSALTRGCRSLVLRQVRVGVAVRMAALCWCVGASVNPSGGSEAENREVRP